MGSGGHVGPAWFYFLAQCETTGCQTMASTAAVAAVATATVKNRQWPPRVAFRNQAQTVVLDGQEERNEKERGQLVWWQRQGKRGLHSVCGPVSAPSLNREHPRGQGLHRTLFIAIMLQSGHGCWVA